MKKRRDLKGKGAAFIAAALAAGMFVPSMAFAAGPTVKVGTDSDIQMSSDPEVVYVNNYAGTTRSEKFNDNWKFYLGDAAGAEDPSFNDSSWEQVNLPHDYSIEQEYTKSGEAESGYLLGGTGWYRKNFTLDSSAAGKRIRIDFGGVYMNSTVWVNGNQVGTHPYGYTPFSFDITDYVNFGGDNVITVKVEHQTPSSRWYSGSGIYRSVGLTVTDPVHVDLYGTKIETPGLAENQTDVATNISTTVVNDSAEPQSVTLTHTVFPKDGESEDSIGTVTTDAVEVAAGSSADIDATAQVNNPTLWDTSDNPALYTVRTEVRVNDQVVDTYDTEYGFRYFRFDSDNGFYLNGEAMKLQGVCMHHDQGSLGSEAWESAISRQVKIMKEMGCNSIRVTHNPASDELIQACNEQGILVIDEAFDGWAWPKNGNSNDYARFFNTMIDASNGIMGKEEDMTWAQFDLSAMIRRGQNAPSVIMWSLGNEVQEGAGSLNDQYANIQANLITWAQGIDTTRPVTRGCNVIKGQTSGIAAEMMDSLSKAGGAAGFNYNSGDQYDIQHQQHPDWFIYGAETASSINSRGVYDRLGNGNSETPSDQKLTSYDNSRVGWGALASSAWYEVITRDFVAGEYVWTGFDYIGEPTPWNGTGTGAMGTWPSPKNSYFGIVDTAGLPKDTYYFYQSQWNDGVDTFHILPAWNGDVVAKDSTGKVPVVVYTDAAKVQLFFTPAGSNEAQDLGVKQFTQETTAAGYTYQIYKGDDADSAAHKNLYLTWKVPYEDGTITAKAWDADGREIDLSQAKGRTSVTTTGDGAVLDASADRTEIAADGTQLSYITVNVEDAEGNIVPDADNRVTFTVEGEGKLLAVDNGKQDDHQSYQDNNRQAFNGQLVAIVQSTKTAGDITVTASADGLKSSSVTIRTTPVEEVSGEVKLNYYLMSRNYYVKTGNMPQLPDTVRAVYSDGSEKDVKVTWDEITEDQIAQTGTFSVAGTTEAGDTVSVTVNMIDEVAALLNYSTTVPMGTEPVLPESRPAVVQTGEVISASFPVTWGEPVGSYDEAGLVRVTGTANVLGKEMSVTADIRVQEQQITIGDNVAGSGYLSQDIPEGQQSDTLEAINDGSTEIADNTSGGPNPTAWSNWTNTNQYNDNDAEITFRYDTQQRVGQIVVYFAKDKNGLRFPDAGTTEIYISETGDDGSWTKVEAEETIAESENPERVKAYTYNFAPQTATFVKLRVVNPTGTDLPKPSVAITEVVINQWQGSYTTNTTAALQSLNVNGLEVSGADLAAGSYNTEAILILIDDIEYAGADNAAVTYIPPYENAAKLIIESEDHSTRNTFTINLGVEASTGDAEDDSRDYPYTQTTATAGSAHVGSSAEGPAELAVDNNLDTWWHTEWNPLASKDQLWITLELDEEVELDALRYLGRSGTSPNGRVTEYRVEVSTDGTEWKQVSTGIWENTEGWKLAAFDEPTPAKYVRLTGLHTFADSGNDKFMSAVEIRLRKTPDNLVDISGATVQPITKKVSVVDAEHPVTLTGDDIKASLADGKELRYGVDYIIASYENNTAEGNAKAVLQGLGQYGYTGTKEIEFTIELQAPVMTGIAITTPCKLDYTEGDLFDPSALVLTAGYDNGMTQTVSYADNAADITFTLSDGTALTPQTVLVAEQDGAAVTVTYGGMTTAFNINVSKGTDPDPGEVTKDDLKAAIDKAEGILGQTGKYTEDSLAEYQKYVDAAYAVYNNPDATAADYAKAIADLTDAEKYLVLNDGGKPGNPDEPGGGTGGSGSGDKAVQTGDTADFAMWGAAALLAGAAVVIAAKKKKSEN